MTRYAVTPGWYRAPGTIAHYFRFTNFSLCENVEKDLQWRYARTEDFGPCSYCRECELEMLSIGRGK